MDNVLAIVVPCLNHVDITKECLQAIKDWTQLDEYTVVLVNDGSTDNTHEVLCNNVYDFPRYAYIRHDSPSGFPVAANAGIKYALDDGYEFICVFNNDCILKNNWIAPMFETLLQHHTIGMVTGTTYNYPIDVDGALDNTNNLFNTEFNLWEKNGPWLFRRTVFDKIGLLDEGYTPAWYEDDDLLVRMALNGFIFGRVENAISLHYDGVTRNDEIVGLWGNQFYKNSHNRFCEKWGIDPSNKPWIIYDVLFTQHKIAYIPIVPFQPLVMDEANFKYGTDFGTDTTKS